MQVEYRLSGISAIVLYQAKATFRQSSFCCQFAGNTEQVTNRCLVLLCHIQTVTEMTLGQQQQMQRSLGGDILYRHHQIVFINFFCRNLTGYYFAKYTVFHTQTFHKVKCNDTRKKQEFG